MKYSLGAYWTKYYAWVYYCAPKVNQLFLDA